MHLYIGSSRPYLDGPREDVLQVVAKFPYMHFGSGCCFHFHDSLGRVVVWLTKREQRLEGGDRIRASFVVKSHMEWDGVPQNGTINFKILEKLKPSLLAQVKSL
jgi:hypothetical protein